MNDPQIELACREALEWIRTPFADQQQLKGVAADCSSFPMACYRAAGFLPADYRIPKHAVNWHMNKGTPELYLDGLVAAGMREIDSSEVQRGDFVVYRYGHAYAHGAIVLAWPHDLIHCSRAARCVARFDATNEGELLRQWRRQEFRIFTFRSA